MYNLFPKNLKLKKINTYFEILNFENFAYFWYVSCGINILKCPFSHEMSLIAQRKYNRPICCKFIPLLMSDLEVQNSDRKVLPISWYKLHYQIA